MSDRSLILLFRAVLFLSIFLAPGIRAAGVVITEFMAANSSGEKDEDGDFSDWIEIYNTDSSDRSLAGWRLSDEAKNTGKWQFPAVVVPKGGFLLVFASGKDRIDPKAKLHTNFKLNSDGGYLALTTPDGSIASEFSPYPRQIRDVSYGVLMTQEIDPLVPQNSVGKLLVPDGNGLALLWMQPAFDDSVWTPATNGVGYDRVPPGGTDPAEPVIPLNDVTAPGDPIVPTSSNSPGSEGVTNAIDNNTATKYLNFDKLNAGLTVTPSRGATVVTGLRLTSANDAPERDPTSFVLSGSNDGQSFTEIARNVVPAFAGRFTAVSVAFNNTMAFTQYRLLFPTVKSAGSAVAMQIAEVEFLGKTGPEPQPIAELVRTSVESALFAGRKTSAYLRLPFVIGASPVWDELVMLVRYDDGFAAWLNGVPIARANNPASFAFDGVAPTNRFRRESVQPVKFDLSPNLLHPGTNLLAVQGWNDRADSPDFLLEAKIENRRNIVGASGYFDVATPRSGNSTVKAGLVSDPLPAQRHGFYDSPFDLALSSPTPGATIRYTTNGTVPSAAKGLIYTAPIHLDRTTVFRAVAFQDNWRPSRVITHTYIFPGDVVRQNRALALAAGFPATWGGQAADYGLDTRVAGPADSFGGKYVRTLAADLKSIPTMSMVMNPDDMFGALGLYSNPQGHGAAWERPGSIELIYPDQRPGFQEDAGFRIQGGAFRGFNLTLKKSFRVIFRGKYGSPTLREPLFGPDAAGEVNNFVLRANSNDAWPYSGSSAVYVRDTFAMESARAMGIVASHSTFVHLYINGLYWGLYNPAERPDAAFCASYYGGKKSTWDAINQDSAPDGNYDAWNRMLTMLSQDFTRNDVYQKIQGNNPDGTRNPAYENLLDVDDMIDYLILNFYIGNTDWPGRNWWAGRDRNNGDGFKFHPWDSETALGLSGVDVNITGQNSAVARPYAALRANADFRLRFGDHVYRHFFHGGAFYVNPAATAWNPALPENNRPAARFSALAGQISRAIVGETARWGDQLRTSPYTRDEHWQPARDSLLTSFFPRRSAIVLQQLRTAGLYPKVDPPVMNLRGGIVEPGFRLILTAPPGFIYYTTNGVDPKNVSNPVRYTAPLELSDVTEVKTRFWSGTEWSALNSATFTVGKPALVPCELHYHPAKPSASEMVAGFANADDFEFIELLNSGTASYDLTGVQFETGIQFSFTGSAITKLAPGAYLLLVKNRSAFEMRYGFGFPIAGEYSGKLDNSGEHVRAIKANNDVVFDFSYGVEPPWPAEADGEGESLELIDLNGDLNSATNWRASTLAGGSPGKTNPAPPLRIEILAATASTVQIAFQGRKDFGYTLYSSASLPAVSWEVAEQGAPLAADRRVEINLPAPATGKARFFRFSIP